jgi:lipid II:glycine glycyltransferase (peptidoglycan interpeptide bridge formation enzyme)
MNIKKITDKSRWEEIVLSQKYNSIFLSWNWGEFEKESGNNFERYAIFRGRKIVGLFPIKRVHAIRGKYLHLRHGPIFDFGEKRIWEEFFRFIAKKAKDEGYWFIRMSPLIPEDEKSKYKNVLSRLKESPMHDVDAEITWVLNLSKNEDELLKEMRKNTRYYIKRAERDGVKVSKTKDSKYLSDFWKIYQDTVKRQSWTAYTKDYIKSEFSRLVVDDQIELYLAEYKGKYIAGSLIVYYGDQAIYHHSGTLTKYQKIPASYLIQWEAIKEAKRRGLKWYNFWGISPLVMKDGEFKAKAGHPWAGLTFFKLGFGGQVRQFIHAKDLPVSKKYYLTRFFEKMERRRRGY